jgi:uncharacterized protein with WD repeat
MRRSGRKREKVKRMEVSDAIEKLNCIYMEVSTDDDREAIDMAIEALKDKEACLAILWHIMGESMKRITGSRNNFKWDNNIAFMEGDESE